MKFRLVLTQEHAYGQIPVINANDNIQFFIQGNLDNPNHTLYLYELNHHELGRLFRDGSGLIVSFTIDVINHSLVHIKKPNSPLTDVFYLSGLNYFVYGNVKQGHYTFRSAFKRVATVSTHIEPAGVTLHCEIAKPEDVPFILLTTILLTQWHVTPLKLPTFPPIGRTWSTSPN